MIDLKELCFKVCDISRHVAKFIQEQRGKISEENTEVKGLNDFVTYVDKTSEKMIIDQLTPLLPNAGFIAEENTNNTKSDEYNWIIDPLDGTTNFIHGAPCYCISIALMQNKEIVLGVVYELNLKECFYAWKNGGAFLNDKAISVSSRTLLKNSLLATGFPYYDYSLLDQYIDLFKHFMQHTHGIRRLGSAAADLAYVAAGRYDGFYEYGLKAWDVAAGALIVQEAGGQVADFNGNTNYIFGQQLVASNTKIHPEFLAIVGKFMNN